MTVRIHLIAACLVATSLSGCAAFGSKSNSGQAGEPEWLEDLRAIGATGSELGVSREAREIEKNLGAR